MQITDYIPYGHEKAVTREDLCRITGMNDRAVRNMIADAQFAGAVILNMQDGAGYFQSDDTEEMYTYYRQEKSRALSSLAKQKGIRRQLKEAGYEV